MGQGCAFPPPSGQIQLSTVGSNTPDELIAIALKEKGSLISEGMPGLHEYH